MSFMSFWRRMGATARLSVYSHLEYRFNLAIDALVQPVFNAIIEIAMWYAIFISVNKPLLGGFTRDHYLAYALWAVFFSRVAANWMYEFRMVDDIDSGRVNGVLARPMSFYEFYLGQFIGYKALTCLASFIIPLAVCIFLDSPVSLARLPAAMALLGFYLLLVHTLSFLVASMAFFFNRIHSLTVAKNISLWMLSGELFPLDLVPKPWGDWLISLPFCSGVYVPVGYLTGRLGEEALLRGFASVAIGLLLAGLITYFTWQRGRAIYSGTGA